MTTHPPLTADQQQLAARWFPLAVKLASTFARRRHLVYEDCISVASEYLCRAARAFDPSRGLSPGTLIGVAVRRGLDQYADSLRRPILFSEMSAEGEGIDPPDRGRPEGGSVEERDLVACIRQALPPRWFYIVRRHFLDGLTLEQIGAEYGGLSAERVRQMIVKAVRRAREAFPALVEG
ncbi:MAG TPA: sigma-70 family RNA polymerase sigma factor [Gemmataceae bacterium]|nr:sigma-70 family RNA polymerase sigma factor [Gemmataceae bacterium]